MKPTFQFTQTNRRHDAVARRRGVSLPKTDYCFRASLSDFDSRRRGEGEPSFRRISGAYFDHEARRHFASEAAFFVLIVLMAALPVAKALGGLFELVRTVAVL